MTASAIRPVALRNGVIVADPLSVARDFVSAYGRLDRAAPATPASFSEADLRLANRNGARISSAEIAAILERRRQIERALRSIDPQTSLTQRERAVPWAELRQLFETFAGIRGVGFSKMTKALHPKRPALIPMLDSVVQRYLEDEAVTDPSTFGERALKLVRAYKRDLDANGPAMRALRRQLAGLGHDLTEVRILDVLIWSARAVS